MDKTTAVTALQNAVAYLKGQQKIKKEIEISLLTGYAKGSISAYLTGASTPSKNFLAKFEQVFGLRLTDFVGAVEVKNPAGAGMESLIRIEGLIRAQAPYIAEIYAHQANVPATKVLKDLEASAGAEVRRLTEELQQK